MSASREERARHFKSKGPEKQNGCAGKPRQGGQQSQYFRGGHFFNSRPRIREGYDSTTARVPTFHFFGQSAVSIARATLLILSLDRARVRGRRRCCPAKRPRSSPAGHCAGGTVAAL